MRDPRYERRRRAAVPAALAAFTLLVVATGAHTPPTWAGGSPFTPAMTIVLPAQQVALAPAGDGGAGATGADSGGSADQTAPAAPATTGNGGGSGSGTTHAGHARRRRHGGGHAPAPKIRHVFLVVLSETDLVALAADAHDAPWFARTLVPQGTLLTRYDAVARGALANGVALLSGQGPTAQTLAGCAVAAGAAPPDVTPDRLGADGQQLGDGCVYPFEAGTVADELTGAGLDWRAYVEGATGACPTAPRDPFAYFHSLLDAGACARHVGGLDALDADLAKGRAAPALLYVAPGPCHDGSATPCAPGAAAGAAAADAFLKDVAGRILASPAYADGGLLVVTSDAPPAPASPPAPAPPTGTTTTTTPVTPTPSTTTTTTPPATTSTAAPAPAAPVPFPTTYANVGDAAAAGAARVGALLISPSARAGASSAVPANHFTLLRAICDLFALQPLGYAGATGLRPLPERVLRPNPS